MTSDALTVEVFDVGDARRMQDAFAVRFEVFVTEQRVPEDEEVDEHDRTDPHAVHALVRAAGGTVVAAGRFYRSAPGTAQIGRMAVRAAVRGTGVGKRLLEALMGEARRRGYYRAALNAQDHAVGFYHRAGFEDDGETFLEAGILHQPMTKLL